ncbi:hypothetical protein IRP63_00575 [Clostridium botulinum]|uniref:Uncharacterized protein n=1 Tax=Clostridium botulinum C/D str. DC5 TaxID=1443128 RepID=A0A0A0IEE2_CLOBO|nr:hypothetical protein [Clostridium botulinum]KEI06764.1 hypothetical protein Z952_03085 [Clostridium botulinum C/D str. BKT75002]KEI10874.1 hypothetical protein Z954_09690 [Clostridium botulinum C/D str. BKT2873]KGM93495.1 hypothetical protein Z956_11520 [Clostridium botulinum D str. CCUG 7971]KGM99327.1 hypothetical protein Z955_07925 [Clostridium botulinum C/D str. DC5]KOC49206.1 hypothetical protein ADU88_06770 [Clostridium botulinum]
MQISLYIGERKKKDKIVNKELLKYIEGDRSDRIKDLILKGLIFEGDRSIDEKLLDMRYMYGSHEFSAITTIEPEPMKCDKNDRIINNNISDAQQPNFSNIKLTRSAIDDDELENRI